MKITFQKGIPGFEELHEFEIRNLEGNEKFKILQAIECEISFVTISPFDIYNEYEIDLKDETIKELDIEGPEDVLILSIITLGRNLETSTMNLKAPLVINTKNRQAKQIILESDNYETKHPLIRSEKYVSNY